MKNLSFSMVKQADQRFKGWFLPTPIQYCSLLSELYKVPFILKCEQFHPTGSNELRGAYYFLTSLKEKVRRQGIGVMANEGMSHAMAYVAHLLNIPCFIFFNKKPSFSFKTRLLSYHAQVLVTPLPGARSKAWAKMIAKEKNIPLISNFNRPEFIASQGGALAVELLKQVPQLKNIIIPLSHPQMFQGLIFYLKKKFPDSVIIGVDFGNKKKKMICDYTICVPQKKAQASMDWYQKNHGGIIDKKGAIGLIACHEKLLPPLEGPTCLIIPSRSY